MNQPFQDYAKLYDLFYEGKDYAGEAKYILALFKKHLRRKPKNLLDLGCGTGSHALVWSKNGIKVTGLERSSVMIDQARAKAKKARRAIRFVQGDVRSFSVGESYEAITSMFAVMSYLTTRGDLLSAFQCIRKHLKPGGVFIFDAWYGPGVIADPPGERVKSFTRGGKEIVRMVKSHHDVDDQRVDVAYDILVLKGNRLENRVKEVHPMHYFFSREVADLARDAGLKLLDCHPFLAQGETLTLSDWNATFVLSVQ